MTRGRLRQSVIAAKTATIRQMTSAMATLPLASLAEFLAEPHMVGAAESYLRRALEALLDLGRHILAKGFGVAATEYKEIPRRLRDAGVLAPEAAERMAQMAGYRNRLVHFYDEVTPEELYEIVSGRRGDIEQILDALHRWLVAHPDQLDDAL